MGPAGNTIKVTRSQLKKGIKVGTGKVHVIQLIDLKLHVRLDINPNDKSSVDDKFTLFGGTSVDAKEYEQIKTTEDDVVEGDDYVDLIFTDLIPDLKYWLEINPGKEGQPYYAIEDMSWDQLESIVRQ